MPHPLLADKWACYCRVSNGPITTGFCALVFPPGRLDLRQLLDKIILAKGEVRNEN